ncbi:formate dehydrogenase subunit alpha [Methanocella arvoryzae]|uniref:formate dehydrogenase (coenzyme F420) n=1 Tax=Methanocella arvoryzae (strain DSM 22066 / NBRC 105507 / MRE50) TaxID=351160 RepID=Q0W2C7_METAR|nr:formate dehydrogenase subunit alpha [Methanocella arvoryzae]CAJ37466.1 formate dehydrogenase, alpha subunit [Methanocella arvoryzae MRE50]
MELRLVPTICPYCGCGCGLNLVCADGRVKGVEPWKRHPVNEGKLCPKGNFAHEFIHSPDRLTAPLIRKNGVLTRATWPEALKLVSERLAEIREKCGSESIGVLASARATNEENYLLQKFARAVLKTPHIDHCARLCHSSTVSGLAGAFGSGAMTGSIKDIEEAKCIFIIGSNTFEAHPLIARRILKARSKGAVVIVADPRFNMTARHADIYVPLRSGGDVALLNAMAHVIITEGLEDRRFIDARTRGFEELKQAVAECTPERAEAITGINASTIREIARIYATSGGSAILYSMGITQHSTGTDNVHAIANLAMLTGNVGKKGSGVNPLRGQNNVQGACDMGCLPDVFPGYRQITDQSRSEFAAAWKTAGEIPGQGLTVVEMFDAALGGKIKAMYVVGENPAVSDPDTGKVERALDGLEFLVVQDIFLTETAKYADVVLPAATFAERDGTFTNTERRVQLIRKAVEPPGEALPDWKIISMLATEMGAEGFEYGSPEQIFDELTTIVPQYRGINYPRLLRPEGVQWPCPGALHPGTPTLFTDGFNHPDGKGIFMPVQYRPPAEQPDAEYPFVLTTGRILFHYHTGSMTRRSPSLDGEVRSGFVEISSLDARRLGIRMDDMVRVTSRRGQIELAARVTDAIVKGTVFIPFHFAEAAANRLTNTALDPVSKMPELKVCAVKLEKVTGTTQEAQE